ncbi:MAG: hypothetical protein NTV06_04565 [candidate division Zixibacteria bacterium]|nr:hypothetical protein [candidate division Zixibacteria bacterium]
MRNYEKNGLDESGIFVGIDVHLRQWHVTVLAAEQELFSGKRFMRLVFRDFGYMTSCWSGAPTVL